MFWVTGILGLALGAAPFVLGYADHESALWTSIILGLVVVIASLAGLIARPANEKWEYWTIAAAGLAVFVAPFFFNYADHAEPLWTGLILGAALAVLDVIKALQPPPVMTSHH